MNFHAFIFANLHRLAAGRHTLAPMNRWLSIRRLALLALLCLPSTACRSTPAASGTPVDAATARAAFETAWKTVESGDADPTHGGVDWNAVKAEFEPRAEACRTREQLRTVLGEMLARLGRSHFGIVPASATDGETDASSRGEGSFGLTLRMLGDRIIVTEVEPGSPAEAAGVRRGWTVRAAAGVDAGADLAANPPQGAMARYAVDARAQALDDGATGSSESWTFETPTGARQTRQLVRAATPGATTQIGLLPPMRVSCEDRLLDAETLRSMGVPADLRIAVITFNVWMPAIAAQIDAAVDRHREADGLVLDLRGNPGGVAAMCMGVAGHFHGQPDSLGTMRTREATLEFRVNPRRSTADGRSVEPFAGPLVIVTDPLSASTSEIFAAGLQALGRARVVGRASAGAALPAQMRELPGGDGLIFAFADFTLPDGRHIEGVGVQPDEPSGVESVAWSAEADPDLTTAARCIAKALRDADCH